MMRTVLERDGFYVMIYTRDHLPQHVHVFKAEAEIIINVADISVRSARNMSGRDARRAQEIVAENREFLWAKWGRIDPIA